MFGRDKSQKQKETTSKEIVRQDPRTHVQTTTAQSVTSNTTVNTHTIINQNTNTVEWRTTQQSITHQQFAGIAEISIRRTPTPAELAEMLGSLNMHSRESTRGVSSKSKPSSFKTARTPTTPTVAKSHSSSLTQSQGCSVSSTVEQQVFNFKDFTKPKSPFSTSYEKFDRSFPASSKTPLAQLPWSTPTTKTTTVINTKPILSSSTYVSPYSSRSISTGDSQRLYTKALAAKTDSKAFVGTPSSPSEPLWSTHPSKAATAIGAKPPTSTSGYVSPYPGRSFSSGIYNGRDSKSLLERKDSKPFVTTSSRLNTATAKVPSSSETCATPKKSSIKSKLKPGCAYILNNEKFDSKNKEFRVGSKQDVIKIRKTLECFKLNVEVLENPTVKQISDLVSKLERKDFSNRSCLIITILSHGNRHDEVAAKDANYSIDDQIVFPILRNPTLENKPKIFFIQACKGDIEKGTFKKDASVPYCSPNEILKCYSTFEGYVAYRTEYGSPFIQTLAERIEKDGHSKSVTDILDEVREFVKGLTGGRQIPSVTTTLTRPFVFGDYC